MTGSMQGTTELLIAENKSGVPEWYMVEVTNMDSASRTVVAKVYIGLTVSFTRRQVTMTTLSVHVLWDQLAPLVLEAGQSLTISLTATPTTQPTWQVGRVR